MRIAICDDDKNDINKLRAIIISSHIINSESVNCFLESKKLLEYITNNKKYDLIFLDIDMPEINGIELGNAIYNLLPNTFIIFTTNYPEYAIDAFECNAYHYLLKPLDRNKVLSVLKKIVLLYQKNHSDYPLKTKSGFINLPINSICYVECCKRHIIFHLTNSTYEVPGKISDAYKVLKEYNFCQIHQGYIVNMKKIINIEKLLVYLDNGATVPISQRKKAEVLYHYSRYLGELL